MCRVAVVPILLSATAVLPVLALVSSHARLRRAIGEPRICVLLLVSL